MTLDNKAYSSSSAELIIPALKGATLSDGQLKDGTQGIKADVVAQGSTAAQAGLHKGDLIVGVNRERVRSIAELRKKLESKPDIIALNVIRGSENLYLLLR